MFIVLGNLVGLEKRVVEFDTNGIWLLFVVDRKLGESGGNKEEDERKVHIFVVIFFNYFFLKCFFFNFILISFLFIWVIFLDY